MCPRKSGRVQDISASSKTRESQLSQLTHSFCPFFLLQPWDPSLSSMTILSCSNTLFVAMCTLKLQPCLLLLVLHVLNLSSDGLEDFQVRTCLQCSGICILNLPRLLFYSEYIYTHWHIQIFFRDKRDNVRWNHLFWEKHIQLVTDFFFIKKASLSCFY